MRDKTAWLIEMQGSSWLGARHLGGYEFYWTSDPYKAIQFVTKEQADLVMMAVRQLRPDLFPNCLPQPIQATEHIYLDNDWKLRNLP